MRGCAARAEHGCSRHHGNDPSPSPSPRVRGEGIAGLVLLAALLLAGAAAAQTVPPRSFFTLPSSNGFGAVMVDARAAKAVHFRERLPATEEPLLDATGQEVWTNGQPQVVTSRGLLFDAYFGLRAAGQQRWLTGTAVDSSGYATAAPAPRGGSGIATLTQHALGLTLTTSVFAPQHLEHAAWAMVLCAKNEGAAAVPGVSVFTLQNLHLGYGRPGVMTPPASNGETVIVSARGDVYERGFAGVVGTRPLGTARITAWNAATPQAQNGFAIVQNTTGDFVTVSGNLGVADDQVTGLQFDLGSLAAGAEQCAGFVSAHHGDPFAQATVEGWLDAWAGTSSARALLDAELAGWAAFQQALRVPAGLSSDEAATARQSAAVLAMSQVREHEAFLREFLSRDGEPRYTRFLDGGTLPATIQHRGGGAVLASLPPGEWTYTWVRDGTYAAVAMAELGLTAQARDALRFFLDAEGGRFQSWNELRPYGMPPYVVSLTRYQGFGVEETDFNAFGPNLEFDGLGLVLWALREHERRTQDTSLVDARWNDVATKVADPLVALIDPATGLLRPDSSIWETHWNGRQRTWTYSNLTAARGLCDAAALADRQGDATRAARYRAAGLALRRAIAARLTDGAGALASNAEELATGSGYFDAAVLEGVAMGLFKPDGRIAGATLDALDRQLRVAAGPGWARNDDRTDHAGQADTSPWGSEYDSAEWAFTDLRGAAAMRAAGRSVRADGLLAWATGQANANAELVPETWDEATGAWKFNAPMVGFGAGVYVLALAQRATGAPEPACGVYFEDEASPDGGAPDAGPADAGRPDAGRPDAGTITPGDAGADGGVDPTPKPPGCGCSASSAMPLVAFVALIAVRARRRRAARPR